MNGISVIVCCYNSADRLRETLTHLSKQALTYAISWEVILVDNNSTDNTLTVANELWHSFKVDIPFKIISENKQGLAHARRKGIDESQYDYLIFCDDDNWLDKNYLQLAFEILENNQVVGMAGGEGEAVLDIKMPAWFEQERASYVVGKQAEKSGALSDRTYLWGAGLVVRKSVLFTAAKFDFRSYLLDREGENLSSGGDSELCNWALLLGYQLWYDQRLKFKHFIPKSRLSMEYVNRLNEGFRNASYWLSKYDYVIFLKQQKRSRLSNFLMGMANLILRPGLNRSHLQFMIGPVWQISKNDDYQFIKRYNRFIYE
jgi:glycosyltransferase involved in cell wall biosynthesis